MIRILEKVAGKMMKDENNRAVNDNNYMMNC